MRIIKNIVFYIIIIGFFVLIIYGIVIKGNDLEPSFAEISTRVTDSPIWQVFISSVKSNFSHPLAILLLQVSLIILIARLFGWLCKKIGQPSVIGEILAGIFIGPSIVGMLFPDFSATLFPVNSLSNLHFLSQFGLILYMFVVGMELDQKTLKYKANEAVIISHASIIIPFTLGVAFSLYIYNHFAPYGVRFHSFAFFLGTAMSITAFPVLARIVQERGINKTKLGTVVITCAAADDITAWCLLAVIIAVVKAGSYMSALYIIGLAILYIVIMLKIIKPFLKRIGDLHSSRENLSKPIVAVFFLTLVLSAYVTELIGVHAVFGAFMAGVIMPDNPKFKNVFTEKVEDVALVLLLPLFFVFTGLRTQISLLSDPYLLKITGLLILVAIIGKFAGSALAAKFVGQSWKDSLTIGALMNTRGLMELVVLNIGYDMGILSPEIFTMMVLMALVTTFMTGPVISLINVLFKTKTKEENFIISELSKFKVLISFAKPERGKMLLRLAFNMTQKIKERTSFTALHLSHVSELNHFNEMEYEDESFKYVIQEAKKQDREVVTLFKPSNDIVADIANVANNGDYDLLLIGIGQSIYDDSFLGKLLGFASRVINPEKILNQVKGKENIFDLTPFDEKTKQILNKTKLPAGIVVDKGFENSNKILVPMFTENDIFIVKKYAQKFITNAESQIFVYDVNGCVKSDANCKEVINMIKHIAPNHICILKKPPVFEDLMNSYNLMLISLESWKFLVESKNVWVSHIPSTVILRDAEG